MPVGYEGPMIHLGSLVAAGMSQFKSATFECSLPRFSRFRNSEDRRNFISAGAAAGIASAFGAPVGGLLFAMEEVSSFWKNKLSWQVFFCCMVATFTTDLLNSSFHGFKYKNDFGTEYEMFCKTFADIEKSQLGTRDKRMLGDCNRWCFVSSIPSEEELATGESKE